MVDERMRENESITNERYNNQESTASRAVGCRDLDIQLSNRPTRHFIRGSSQAVAMYTAEQSIAAANRHSLTSADN